jgi:large subunit ribosomal protein L25
MEKIVLDATKREVIGKKVKYLRSDGKVPAVVYGRDIESLAIVLDLKSTKKMHIDFQAVVMGELIKARARVVFEGEAPAVAELSAMLISGAETVEIECLPKDLLDQVVIDISILDRFGAGIYVRDLEFPEGVTALDSPDTMLALTTAPAIEEEEEVEEDELLLDITGEPEVIEKGKDEDDSLED